MEAGQAAGSASADAGDDAVEAEANTGSAGGNDGGAGEGSQGSGGGDGGGADGSQGVSGEELTEAAIRASRLLARATAAKEAGGRAINLMAATPEEGTCNNVTIGGVHALMRLRQRAAANRLTTPDEADMDGDDADDD